MRTFWLTRLMGRSATLAAVASLTAGWIGLNLWLRAAGHGAWDEPPFPWLQLALLIYAALAGTSALVAIRHQAEDAERRAMLELQVDLLAERKVAKVIEMLKELRRDMPDVPTKRDPEVERLARPVDAEAVVSAIAARSSDAPLPPPPSTPRVPRTDEPPPLEPSILEVVRSLG